MSDQSTLRRVSKHRASDPLRKYNPMNERLKRQHATYLKEAEGLGEDSVRHALAAINDFEVSNARRCFGTFKAAEAVAYKERLAQRESQKTGKPLSKVTRLRSLQALQRFFRWLSDQPGYRTRVRASDANYFCLSKKEKRIASAVNLRTPPSVTDVERLLEAMPSETPIDKRNRAIVAILILTGARVGAVASLRIKHLDLNRGVLIQDPREVRTKFGKSIETFLIDLDGNAPAVLADWVSVLTRDMQWGPDDPLFPKTAIGVGSDFEFVPTGLLRDSWRSGIPIRRILEEACAIAGLPRFNPHSFRHAVAQLGLKRARTPEEMKAWSQNLGHSGMLTTLQHYGSVNRERQREIIASLKDASAEDKLDQVERLIRELKSSRDR
jgi:integrase